VKPKPEHIAPGRPVDRQLSRGLSRHGEVALATELERLELDLNLVAVLLTGTEPELAQGIGRHSARVASGTVVVTVA
jgi:hypothetical protein